MFISHRMLKLGQVHAGEYGDDGGAQKLKSNKMVNNTTWNARGCCIEVTCTKKPMLYVTLQSKQSISGQVRDSVLNMNNYS